MRITTPSIFFSLTLLLSVNYTLAAAPPPVSLNEQMNTWWADLEKWEPDASRALLNFSSHPVDAVAFFKRKLRPLAVDPEIVQALLTQLGSNKESEWKAAFDDLEYFDPRLAIDLPTLMDQVQDSPARERLVEVLSGYSAGSLAGKKIEFRKFGSGQYNFSDGRGSWWAEPNISRLGAGGWNSKPAWTRATRAIVLLEHIATPGAVAIIKDMVTGNPDALPTKVARESLARLANQNKVYNSKP